MAQPITSPITNVVLIIKENHGFDNYFGTFPVAAPRHFQDDWGGWYDHVDPPVIEKRTDGTQFYPGGGVGCLALSPYAKRGYLSHAQHTHVSLVKFCEVSFGLPHLNARDAASDGMEDCFDFTQPKAKDGAVEA